MPGEIDQVARRSQHPLAAAGDLDPRLGQGRLAGPALDQFGLEFAFQVANLHGQAPAG